MNNFNKMKILSYYELRKLIDESKCILNDDILNYMDMLLSLDVSVLYKDGIDNIAMKYLKQLKLFRDLALYNIYNRSFGLIDMDENRYKIINSNYNGINIAININDFNYNIFSMDYRNNMFNLYFYGHDNVGSLSQVNDNLIKYCENEYLLSCERRQIFEKFLFQNNLSLSDFFEINTSGKNRQKIRKYDFANVIVK